MILKPWYRIFAYLVILPLDVIWAWPATAVVRLLWGESMVWEGGSLVVTLKADSWPRRTWYAKWGGTCFGHGIMLSPGMDPSVLQHELVHVKQLESAGLAGLLLGVLLACLGWWWIGLLVWPLNTVLVYLCGGVVAVLRGQSFYRGNHLEEAARTGAGQGL